MQIDEKSLKLGGLGECAKMDVRCTHKFPPIPSWRKTNLICIVYIEISVYDISCNFDIKSAFFTLSNPNAEFQIPLCFKVKPWPGIARGL